MFILLYLIRCKLKFIKYFYNMSEMKKILESRITFRSLITPFDLLIIPQMAGYLGDILES